MRNVVILDMVNPRLTDSYCKVGDKRFRYVEWELPAIVTTAIGLGCAGRRWGSFEGSPTPRVRCLILSCSGHSILAAQDLIY